MRNVLDFKYALQVVTSECALKICSQTNMSHKQCVEFISEALRGSLLDKEFNCDKKFCCEAHRSVNMLKLRDLMHKLADEFVSEYNRQSKF
jgi:hypothetical protein